MPRARRPGHRPLHVRRHGPGRLHPRLPIEKQADTRFFAPDGTLTVVGKPVQLIGRDGGVVVIDAGRVVIGEDLVVNGPHPYLETRFAEG
ncbi:MAG TPA: hypothetical protein VJN29_06105 [Intrasporangium sp.]|uniref:hypothetical protein n=1 Tax=Intrasporangium sp. TaxID=1925024 RepID=UPI002B487403|nr:hypothetical protein [Intrasporangium sp.]HKX66780.1 hypothetical protein [Intrasporangium sp.]